MSKINEMVADAVRSRRSYFKCGNTEVMCDKNSIRVYLHDNLIYKRENGKIMFTLAGWNTRVTRNRLAALGVDVYGGVCSGWSGCVEGKLAMYNGKVIDSNKWYNV